MRVRVVSVGRDRDFTAAGSAEYAERLKRACTIELVELRAETGPAAAEREGKSILAAASKGKQMIINLEADKADTIESCKAQAQAIDPPSS